ncbi:hypothetical protein [Thermosediminibacter oceani]|uniref:Ribbon-helix-helix protein CopG domain-containing protein n=1 Tax=Thermosediminibacter oceani (strain ATCC BAA-1034 / DSM 16646 / JW/IW-1228P) TaxID=555079 RepID=D9S1C5_THEOJ|nr:hypothetical protein [Thermosediminibacter oceani]ADL07202.1 conserved hypothetical protein [Thermosediminibacter oceani DSM 16646]
MKKVTVYLSENTYDVLNNLSSKRKESMSLIARKILEKGLTEEAAKDGIDAVTDAVRRAMRDILKPTEDRLAKLAAKAAVAAATAMYLNTQCIADLGKNNALELYQIARTKAVAYLREKDEEA